jgi:hypothetical protein
VAINERSSISRKSLTVNVETHFLKTILKGRNSWVWFELAGAVVFWGPRRNDAAQAVVTK